MESVEVDGLEAGRKPIQKPYRCRRCGGSAFRRYGNGYRYCPPCDAKTRAGWYQRNRDRAVGYRATYRSKDPEQLRNYQRGVHLRLRYGLNHSSYDALFHQQQGTCAICKRLPKTGRRLHVDHDHQTGLVRGLLCDRCNTGLACFRDCPEGVQAALDYLAMAQTQPVPDAGLAAETPETPVHQE